MEFASRLSFFFFFTELLNHLYVSPVTELLNHQYTIKIRRLMAPKKKKGSEVATAAENR